MKTHYHIFIDEVERKFFKPALTGYFFLWFLSTRTAILNCFKGMLRKTVLHRWSGCLTECVVYQNQRLFLNFETSEQAMVPMEPICPCLPHTKLLWGGDFSISAFSFFAKTKPFSGFRDDNFLFPTFSSYTLKSPCLILVANLLAR